MQMSGLAPITVGLETLVLIDAFSSTILQEPMVEQ